jgi:hypothetical protein
MTSHGRPGSEATPVSFIRSLVPVMKQSSRAPSDRAVLRDPACIHDPERSFDHRPEPQFDRGASVCSSASSTAMISSGVSTFGIRIASGLAAARRKQILCAPGR